MIRRTSLALRCARSHKTAQSTNTRDTSRLRDAFLDKPFAYSALRTHGLGETNEAGRHHVPSFLRWENTLKAIVAPIGPFVPFATHGRGAVYHADSLALMREMKSGSVNLIVTSPPFALTRKKEYGNQEEAKYVEWFLHFAHEFRRILVDDGSLVVDLGGAYMPGLPVRSIYQFELLVRLVRDLGFYLAQDFYHYNPSRLPTPAEWVTVRRLRVKDSVNVVWWLSKTPYPKASNRHVLQNYSESMLSLIKNGYKAKLRPSGHDISTKFQIDNGGAIPANLLTLANTESNSAYLRRCKAEGIKPHPARFPVAFPEFFVKFLTEAGDVVFDPFAGSLATAVAADLHERTWICSELDESYIRGGLLRFAEPRQIALVSRDSEPSPRRRQVAARKNGASSKEK